MKKYILFAFFIVSFSISNSQAQELPAITQEYISSLKKPFSNEDLINVSSNTKSTKEPGFQMMLKEPDAFKKSLGSEKYHAKLNRIIFDSDISEMFALNKSWEEIEEALKNSYGSTGEEAYLLTRAGVSMNMKQWQEFLPIAKLLIQKYGGHLSESSRKKFQDAINANQ